MMDQVIWLQRRAEGTTEFGVMQVTNGFSTGCVEENPFAGQPPGISRQLETNWTLLYLRPTFAKSKVDPMHLRGRSGIPKGNDK